VPAGLDDPVFALATPLAPSALAVLRISGRGSLQLLAQLLEGRPALASARGHTARRVVIVDGGERIDEALVTVFRAPRSYTGEDGAEVSCHGSLPVIRRIVALLGKSGFRGAGPGEFTRRAFLNGRIDLTRAEAVNEIVRARTDRARALALQRLSGAVERAVARARQLLLDLQAAIEVALDYPDDDHGAQIDGDRLHRAEEILASLAATWTRGRIYQEGVSVAIAGATNAGKSSLFNLLLRQERAIVSEVHGTTRDWLEGSVDVGGIPVRLFDTAGIRDTDSPIEREGVRRTGEILGSADLVLYLVDAVAGTRDADSRWTAGIPGARILRVWNKVDLPQALPCPAGFLPVSAVTGDGIDALEHAVSSAVLQGPSAPEGEPLIDSERQRDLLARSLAALGRFREGRDAGMPLDVLAVELREALDSLGEVTGEVTSAEVLERMFSSFCVGK
jgi:tRNA modification GTPase